MTELPDWARAHGVPLLHGRLRTVPEDFQVTEILDIELTGEGEHDFLYLQKTGANTEWVARQLARHADVPNKDVGYAGLKDRHAVTRQWFSVPCWNAPDWTSLDIEGVELKQTRRHHRKLKRGAHRGNRFRVVVRADVDNDVDARLETIRDHGLPNYFGEQRFGREASNLQLADDWAAGKRLPRHKRSLAISTIRSFEFNGALHARVQDGTWNTLQAGDLANLDGTGSVFGVETVDDQLLQRCADMDLHPAGVLIGDGSTSGRQNWLAALCKARVEPGSRSYRLCVQDLNWSREDDALTLQFYLPRGAFATAVLREIATTT